MEKVYEDVEMMVNEPKRQEAIRERYVREEAKKQWKLANNAIAFAVVGVLFVVLDAFGGLAPWIAVPGCMASVACAVFNFGRWYENVKCRGQKKWR